MAFLKCLWFCCFDIFMRKGHFNHFIQFLYQKKPRVFHKVPFNMNLHQLSKLFMPTVCAFFILKVNEG